MVTRERIEELSEKILELRTELLAAQAERDALESKTPTSKLKHPIQRIYKNEHGVYRFTNNAIVDFLLENGGHDLNDLACRNFDQADREQFAQLIGYSVDGFASLSYVSDEAMGEVNAALALLDD